jgi:hypothetical protein
MNSNKENIAENVKFSNLVKWCRENGGFVHNLITRKKNKQGVYGIIATDRIEKGTVIFQVPEKNCINDDENINYGDCNLMFKTLINILIEYKKGKKSKWHHTFSLLPSYDVIVNNSIWNCNKELINNLQEIGYNVQATKEWRDKKLKNIIKLNNKYKYVENLTLHDLIYCFEIHANYSWETFDPIMCFMNHKTGSPKRTPFNIEKTSEKVYRYTTDKVMEKGEEIFDSYGDIKSTEELAFHLLPGKRPKYPICELTRTKNGRWDFNSAKITRQGVLAAYSRSATQKSASSPSGSYPNKKINRDASKVHKKASKLRKKFIRKKSRKISRKKR